jgi:hypothetical protein
VLDVAELLTVHLVLLPGQGGDELAAEVGDVGDHAAPDQVRSGQETPEHVSDEILGCT